MNVLYFSNEEDAKNSNEYKNKSFVRLMRDMSKEKNEKESIIMEMIDFGTHLRHHNIIKINFDKIKFN